MEAIPKPFAAKRKRFSILAFPQPVETWKTDGNPQKQTGFLPIISPKKAGKNPAQREFLEEELFRAFKTPEESPSQSAKEERYVENMGRSPFFSTGIPWGFFLCGKGIDPLFHGFHSPYYYY